MKKILLLFIAVSFKTAMAQSLSPDVIATAGTSFTDGTSQLDWTLGEPTTATFSAGTDILTQGFHQPNLLATAINNVETEYSLLVYPNPSIDYIQLQFQNLNDAVTVRLLSSDGKLLQSQELKKTSEIKIDMSMYASGTYLLSVTDNQSKVKTYQVVKLN